ncbi:glycoside hydrolase family 15 protein [Algibacillus agarilyticus]|uniref:glycoside hydrolase family 15 protein n=1 Tax=Algibacillus agarilyticus TaxID=2234133 RepID=UPI000DD04233|nr:glycoside hydrolase family 15 protein [Algibacillus agarilyticus]
MKNTELLNTLYKDIKQIILNRQNPITGLLPASTAITTHGDYTDAWVRDNVYSILSVWSLSMAFKRNGETDKRDQLEQSTVKLMRGLLQSMMRQSAKVETFKHTSDSLDCLHAKYDTNTGLPVVDDDKWGHLQIDATSIFLLMVAQMSASGLRIIKTLDEVDFIQNLIYYIAFAYRIPDYGIWERGNKINNGKTEINASSVGMAKAALQALDGFNLFGPNATARAVVHTIPDAISRARNTLARLLPRESVSKEVDSAILSIIGFPAFAVGDQKLVDKTRSKILTELGGEYGCKRFLWDGHQAANEDHTRIHYNHSELASFENIECEWPLFYTYLYIQALFDDDKDQASFYREKLESVMVEIDGKGLLPELYIVPEELIEAERKNPGSQKRIPNENLPLVWAQSMYYTGLMLDTGLIEKDDLDPLQLRNRSTSANDTQIALVVLAENDYVKKQLAQRGVLAESIDDIKPLQVMSASSLVEAYQKVGTNDALGLTGRPKRRFQGLATAQTYNINKQDYLCLSSLQHDEIDYQLFDAQLASEHLQSELNHINKHWINEEVAVFTYMVKQAMFNSENNDVFFDTLRNLQLRSTHVNVGYASASLAFRASRVNHLWVNNRQVQSITATPEIECRNQYAFDVQTLNADVQEALPAFDHDSIGYQQLVTWLTQYKLSDTIGTNIDFEQFIDGIYQHAEYQQHWLTARLCFSVLNYTHKEISEDLSLLCARNISISMGNVEPITLADDDARLEPLELIEKIDTVSTDLLERTLLQELLVILGFTIRTQTILFSGLRSIDLHSLLAVCASHNECTEDTYIALAALSPFELLERVKMTLENQHQAYSLDVENSFSKDDANSVSINSAMNMNWLEWRSARGLITRFDDEFLNDIYQSLAKAKKIVFSDRPDADEFIDCELVRSSMTSREESFAHLLDSLIQHFHPIYFKAAIVEVLFTYIQYCSDNPEKVFNSPIVLGHILEQAADDYVTDEGKCSNQERNLDCLLQQSPEILQAHTLRVLAQLT